MVGNNGESIQKKKHCNNYFWYLNKSGDEVDEDDLEDVMDEYDEGKSIINNLKKSKKFNILKYSQKKQTRAVKLSLQSEYLKLHINSLPKTLLHSHKMRLIFNRETIA